MYVLVCGALPFDGSTLQSLRDRVLSGRFRIPFFLSSGKNHRYLEAQLIHSFVLECESLIRKMLVLQPSKRITIEEMKHHRWMTVEVMETLKVNGNISCDTSTFQPNEQVVRIMQNLGIDSQRTRDSLKVREF